MVVNYRLGTADKRNISNHLWHCDNLFNPPLSSRVDIEKYAEKISDRSVNFEAWEEKN